MGRSFRDRPKRFNLNFKGKSQFDMCDRKRKFKSGEASKWADKFDQRKYECPFCGHWHLTSKKRG